MFRLVYSPTKTCWLIQFLTFGMVWISVKSKDFDTYEQARDFIKLVGIDQAYDEYTFKGSNLAYVGGAR